VIYRVVLVSFAVVGFAVCYVTQQLSPVVYAVLTGLVISLLLTLPLWAYSLRQQLKWQPTQWSSKLVQEVTVWRQNRL
jgi:hypothetical protein